MRRREREPRRRPGGAPSTGPGHLAILLAGNDGSGAIEIRSWALRATRANGFESDPGSVFLGRRQAVDPSVVT